MQHTDIWFHKQENDDIWKTELQDELVIQEHERICHAGVFKTLNFIKRKFWFKHMIKNLKHI